MALLNYTSTVAPTKTVEEILTMLRHAGARRTSVDWLAGAPEAVLFTLRTDYGEPEYRLPVNVAAVERALNQEYAAGAIDRRFASAAQAQRTAWRIVKDWLESQLAVAASGVLKLDQVMLPFMVTDDAGRTMYERFRQQQLLPGRTSPPTP